MDVTQTSTLAPNAAATAANADQSDNGMINSDFQTFLNMLTTQMRNQDPLNPMDSTEFSTQLATFSGVEQQVRTNDLLTALQQSLGQSSVGEMADWIGMDARAEMPMAFQGEPLTLFAPTRTLADRMELIVTDAAGTELQRVAIPVGDTPFEWAGVTTDGSPLPQAVYGFEVEYFAQDVSLGIQSAQGYAQINEAQILNGEVWLSMPGGVQLRSDLVQAMRGGT
jgi:flagellar basal-body rod modification protein FlgD